MDQRRMLIALAHSDDAQANTDPAGQSVHDRIDEEDFFQGVSK